jgi:hypothetical protein
VALIFWATNPTAWSTAFAIRDLALILELPLFLLAAVDWLVAARGADRDAAQQPRLGKARGKVIVAVALSLAVVLCSVGASWSTETHLVSDQLNASTAACVLPSQVGERATALTGWWSGSLAILLQERVLHHIVVDGQGCSALRSRDIITLGGVQFSIIGGHREPYFSTVDRWRPGGWFRVPRSLVIKAQH